MSFQHDSEKLVHVALFEIFPAIMLQYLGESFSTARVKVNSKHCVLKIFNNSIESRLILLYLLLVDPKVDFLYW